MRFYFFIGASFKVDTIKGWYVSWKRHYFFFFLVVLFQKCGLSFCGAVHTWCLGTTAWISAQNGVVFTLWVPDICDCVHSYALSDSILKHELSSENKAVECPELTKIVCKEGPGAHFYARKRLRPCTRAPAPCPNSSVGTWKKDVFILVPSHYRTWAESAWATSVNAACEFYFWQQFFFQIVWVASVHQAFLFFKIWMILFSNVASEGFVRRILNMPFPLTKVRCVHWKVSICLKCFFTSWTTFSLNLVPMYNRV